MAHFIQPVYPQCRAPFELPGPFHRAWGHWGDNSTHGYVLHYSPNLCPGHYTPWGRCWHEFQRTDWITGSNFYYRDIYDSHISVTIPLLIPIPPNHFGHVPLDNKFPHWNKTCCILMQAAFTSHLFAFLIRASSLLPV